MPPPPGNFITTPILGQGTAAADVNYTKFTPIAALCLDEMVVAVHADSEYQTLEELVNAAKAAPDTVLGGGTQWGSSDSICYHLIEKATGYQGKKCEDVVSELVQKIYEAGYFQKTVDGHVKNIVVKLEEGSAYPDNEFLEEVAEGVRKAVNSCGITSSAMTVDEDDLDDNGYIGLEKAKDLVLSQLGLKEASFTDRELDSSQGEKILEDPFHMAATTMLIVEGMPPAYTDQLRAEIEKLDNVSSAVWLSSMVGIQLPTDMIPAELRGLYVRELFLS